MSSTSPCCHLEVPWHQGVKRGIQRMDWLEKWQVPGWDEGVRQISEWVSAKVCNTCVIGSLHVVQNALESVRWELGKLSFKGSKCLGIWNPHVWDIPNLHHTDLLLRLRENAIPQSIRSKIMRTLQQHLWEATSKVVSLAEGYQKTVLGGQIIDITLEILQIELGDFSTFLLCLDRASKPKSCCWWRSCVDEGWWLPSLFNRHLYCVWCGRQDPSACLQAHGIVAKEFVCSQCAINILWPHVTTQAILLIKLAMCRMACHVWEARAPEGKTGTCWMSHNACRSRVMFVSMVYSGKKLKKS